MDPSDKQAARYRSKNIMGYIQDKVDVGMTKLRHDDGKAIDVAIVKATLQDAVVPKEKHVVTLKNACAAHAPRQQVNYVIHGLSKRLEDKPGWLVTLKTLIVFHRLMREVDPSFQDEIIRYQDRTGAHRMLRLEAFADHTTKDTWDYSAWVRVYSVYLDERLGVFKAMRFDPELDGTAPTVNTGAYGGGPNPYGGPPAPPGAPLPASGASGTHTGTEGAASKDSRLKTCSAAELLEKLPMMQRLLNRLIACMPEGAALTNEIVVLSCSMVLREMRSTYRAVCEGIINLADKYFEMERADALKGLDLYKDNVALNEKLNTFFSAIGNVPSLRGLVQMPTLQSLPADFLTTMEEYVRDAPKVIDASTGGARAGPTGGPTGGSLRNSSTMIRASGTTSPSLTGTGGVPPAIPAPIQGVLKIGPPVGDAAPPAPAPPPPVVDLLGDDFDAPAPSPGAAAPPPPAAAPEFASPPPAQPQGFADSAFGAPPAFPPPAGGPGAAPGGFNPFGPPGGAPGGSPGQPAPYPGAAGGYGSPPQPANPFGGPTGGGYPGAPPHNPFSPPGYPNPGAYPPPPPAFGGAPAAHGYGMAPPAPAGPPAGNPFGGAGPVWGSGPPPGAAAWGTNVVAGQTTMKKAQDPLNDIGVDLFGKPNTAPVQQSLRDMKLQN